MSAHYVVFAAGHLVTHLVKVDAKRLLVVTLADIELLYESIVTRMVSDFARRSIIDE